MADSLFSRVREIPTGAIEAHDRTFAILSPHLPLGPLLESVREVGILTPLHLQGADPGPYRIVSGFRRHEAASRLQFPTVPAVIRRSRSGLSLFRQALFENLALHVLGEFDKATVLSKLRLQFAVDEDSLIREYLPLLQVNPNRSQLRRYLGLGGLPESVRLAGAEGLSPQVALAISGWDAPEQEWFLTLVQRYRLGGNKQKQLFALLDELSLTHESPREAFSKSGARQVDRNEQVPAQQRFDSIVRCLRQLRYPVVTEYQERYRHLKAALNAPASVRFEIPPFFEGDEIRIGFAFRKPEQLKGIARWLADTADRDELSQILEML